MNDMGTPCEQCGRMTNDVVELIALGAYAICGLDCEVAYDLVHGVEHYRVLYGRYTPCMGYSDPLHQRSDASSDESMLDGFSAASVARLKFQKWLYQTGRYVDDDSELMMQWLERGW